MSLAAGTTDRPTLAEAANFYARDVDFDLDSALVSEWSGNEYRSLFLNALSITFPVGERFFIGSVAHYRKRIANPKLRAEVNAFVAQEALHTREHLEYNVALENVVDVAHQEKRISAIFNFTKKYLGPKISLEVTCALEHFTAILAKEVLEHDAHLRGANERYARLWTWHALEECEHKAVSYDVYNEITNGKGNVARVLTMIPVTIILYALLGVISFELMKGRGHAKSPLAWVKLAWAVFGRDGLMRRIMPNYLRYFSLSFHPNDIDDETTRSNTKRLVESWA